MDTIETQSGNLIITSYGSIRQHSLVYSVKHVDSLQYDDGACVHTVFLAPSGSHHDNLGAVRPFDQVGLRVDDPSDWKLGRRVNVTVELIDG
jgi:hypothetical protein